MTYRIKGSFLTENMPDKADEYEYVDGYYQKVLTEVGFQVDKEFTKELFDLLISAKSMICKTSLRMSLNLL